MILKRVIIILVCAVFLAGCGGAAPEDTNRKNVEPISTPSPDNTNKMLASFATKLLDKDKERVKNIKLAAEAINGLTLAPGEVFSFNKTVGPRTEARGFKKALMIVRKKKVEGYGGGICQVSSTLYNAARDAGLEIVERHQHDKEVGYVELGDDATVSYGSLDLKVKNNKSIPVKLFVSVNDNTVSANVETSE